MKITEEFATLRCMAISPHPLRWCALLLGAAVLTGASACGSTADSDPSAATTSSPVTGALLDKAAACTELTKDLDVLKMRAFNNMNALLDAESDPSMLDRAVEDVRELYAEMQATTEKHVATTGDPELKAALTAFGEQIKSRRTAMDAAGRDIDQLFETMDDPAFEEAGEKLDQLCP